MPFAEFFGLKPWEVGRLTLPQWQRFRARADQRMKGG